MTTGRITQLRLTEFKSYRDVVLPLAPLTLLIGRNGSGKSNALDALEILSRLARGDEVRDALEGRREGGSIRGGLEGCAPHGSDRFTIGVTLETDVSEQIDLDLTVQVSPQPQIIAETLSGYVRGGDWWRAVLESEGPSEDRSDLDAAIWNNKRGPNPRVTFRGSHLLTAQAALRLGTKTTAETEVMAIVSATLAVLSGVFQLDPVPHLMRQYVPERDAVLRRTAANVSAAVGRLHDEEPDRFERLIEVVRTLPEYEVEGIEIGHGPYGDVMLALLEAHGEETATVPARQMSDGMLRMLAIATALLGGGAGVDTEGRLGERAAAIVLVIEELENGLHPSQAGALLALVQEASREQGFQVLLTTHSPALLNALGGEGHGGVLVVERDRISGQSQARRLVELPGYLRLMARRRLGDATASGELRIAAEPMATPSEGDLDRMLGLA